MVNIFHIIVGLNIGGAELMLKRLVFECSKNQNCNQTVVTLKGPGVIQNELLENGIDVINLNINSLFSLPNGVLKLSKLIKKYRPDAVYTWMYHADFLGGMTAYFSGIKNIIWGIRCTNIPQNKFSRTGIILKLCSILSYFVPKVIICCAHSAKNLHIKLGYCKKKMVVIQNGYDLTQFNPSIALKHNFKKRIGLNEDTRLIGIVGRFDILKDYKNFLMAAGIVAKKFHDVNFVMVGRGIDNNNMQLLEWIKQANISDRVFLLGEVNPHDAYAAMDLFCLSSRAEGFPNVVAEAMAMEVPCVVTDVGDAKDLVKTSGIVVKPEDPFQLAEGIISVFKKSKSDLLAMGNLARELISKNYDIKKIAEEYMRYSSYKLNNELD